MRYEMILNRGGGTLRTMDLEAFCAEARSIFAEAGHECTCTVVEGKDIEAALEKAAASDVDAIVAGGGDGTISAAAAIAFKSGKPLAVLPAGTMNLFARALGGPLDLPGALGAIAAGEFRKIDIGTANGTPFVHQFGVGIHARLVRIRDQMVFRSRIGKMVASVRAISAAVVDPPQFEVDLLVKENRTAKTVAGIVVSNNILNEAPVPVARRLDEGVLDVVVAKTLTTGELVSLIFDVFTGRWRDNALVEEEAAPEITLRFPKRKRRAHAVIDGELIPLDEEVVLRCERQALTVIMPRSADEQSRRN